MCWQVQRSALLYGDSVWLCYMRGVLDLAAAAPRVTVWLLLAASLFRACWCRGWSHSHRCATPGAQLAAPLTCLLARGLKRGIHWWQTH